MVTTGVHTYLGGMASAIMENEPPTSFDQGLTWLMIRLMAVMVPLVFLINGFTKHDWKGAFFFAMAVAVGLTPEMLPMIVSGNSSRKTLFRSRKAYASPRKGDADTRRVQQIAQRRHPLGRLPCRVI